MIQDLRINPPRVNGSRMFFLSQLFSIVSLFRSWIVLQGFQLVLARARLSRATFDRITHVILAI